MLRKTLLMAVVLGITCLIGVNTTLANGSGVAMVQEIRDDAKQAMLPCSKPFKIGSFVSDIKGQWGNPTSERAEWPMLFNNKHMMFNYKENVVQDLTWMYGEQDSPQLITYQDIQQVLGEPSTTLGEPSSGNCQVEYKLITKKMLRFTLDQHKVTLVELR